MSADRPSPSRPAATPGRRAARGATGGDAPASSGADRTDGPSPLPDDDRMIDAVVRSATSATSATSAASATRTSGGRRRTAARPGPRDDRTTGGADADVDRDRGDAGADRATGATVSLLPVATRVRSQGPDHDPRRGDVDEWGRSEQMRALVRRLYDPMYRRWFRVEWEGLEKIPTEGGALLVANHAGAIPADAPAIMHGIETELHRPVYGLADTFFRTVPVVGTLWSRTGGVPALPDNAYRLLHDQQQLALVFPEGTKATSKAYTDRYRLRRFGRGGFVEIAMRAGVPIVPIAVVGAEESMPIVFRLPAVAKALGLPYFPVTANLLAFGPLGLVTYFPAKFKLRVLDPVHFDVEPGAERYSRSRVMDESEAIRARLQDTLHDMLRARRSVWFG